MEKFSKEREETSIWGRVDVRSPYISGWVMLMQRTQKQTAQYQLQVLHLTLLNGI